MGKGWGAGRNFPPPSAVESPTDHFVRAVGKGGKIFSLSSPPLFSDLMGERVRERQLDWEGEGGDGEKGGNSVHDRFKRLKLFFRESLRISCPLSLHR